MEGSTDQGSVFLGYPITVMVIHVVTYISDGTWARTFFKFEISTFWVLETLWGLFWGKIMFVRTFLGC